MIFRPAKLRMHPCRFLPSRGDGDAGIKTSKGTHGFDLLSILETKKSQFSVFKLLNVLFVRFVEYWIQSFRGETRTTTLLDIRKDVEGGNKYKLKDHKKILIDVLSATGGIGKKLKNTDIENLFVGYEETVQSFGETGLINDFFRPNEFLQKLQDAKKRNLADLFHQILNDRFPCENYEAGVRQLIEVYETVPKKPPGTYIQIICESQYQQSSKLRDMCGYDDPFYLMSYLLICNFNLEEYTRRRGDSFSGVSANVTAWNNATLYTDKRLQGMPQGTEFNVAQHQAWFAVILNKIRPYLEPRIDRSGW